MELDILACALRFARLRHLQSIYYRVVMYKRIMILGYLLVTLATFSFLGIKVVSKTNNAWTTDEIPARSTPTQANIPVGRSTVVLSPSTAPPPEQRKIMPPPQHQRKRKASVDGSVDSSGSDSTSTAGSSKNKRSRAAVADDYESWDKVMPLYQKLHKGNVCSCCVKFVQTITPDALKAGLIWFWQMEQSEANVFVVKQLKMSNIKVPEKETFRSETFHVTNIPAGECYPGVMVCKSMFMTLYAINRPWLNTCVRRALGLVPMPLVGTDLPSSKETSEAFQRAKAWFRGYAEEVGEPQPNAIELHCDYVETNTLYNDEYILDLTSEQEAHISLRSFYRATEEEAEVSPKIRLLKKKGTSTICDRCVHIANDLQNAGLNKQKRKVAHAARRQHMQDVACQRMMYWKNRERGRRWGMYTPYTAPYTPYTPYTAFCYFHNN